MAVNSAGYAWPNLPKKANQVANVTTSKFQDAAFLIDGNSDINLSVPLTPYTDKFLERWAYLFDLSNMCENDLYISIDPFCVL